MRRVLLVLLLGFAACEGTVSSLEDAAAGLDAGADDAGRPDAGDELDSGVVDAGGVDAGGVDAGGVDAGGVDAGGADAGGVDAGGVDAGGIDAGVPDAGGADAGFVDAGSPPDAGRFPLSVADGGAYLVDRFGQPFLMTGEAAWSLVVQLNRTDTVRYLDARRAQGFNTLLVNLIEHQFSSHAPNDDDGNAPFLSPGAFGQPNPAYLARAEWVVSEALARGFLVLLAPAYVGYGGGSEGWWVEMSASTPTACATWADAVGTRLAAYPNVLWVHGGDYYPPQNTAGIRCSLAIRDTLATKTPAALSTAHYSRNSASRDHPDYWPQVQVNAVYTGAITHQRCLSESGIASPKPTFLIEAIYENESSITRAGLRAQAWWAFLSCTSGYVFGNRPIWPFEAGWDTQLSSNGSTDLARAKAFLDTVAWHTLVPDRGHTLVTAGYGTLGGTDYVTAALSRDASFALAYVPSTGSGTRQVTVDGSRFAQPVRVRWFNPTSGVTTTGATLPAAAGQVLTTPGDNGTGTNDWVLLLSP